MKKEIERLYEEYKDIIESDEIVLQMFRSDCYDNRSPRCYRISVRLKNDELIGEWGFCRNWQKITRRFEDRLLDAKCDMHIYK